jgi:hypothetical protein
MVMAATLNVGIAGNMAKSDFRLAACRGILHERVRTSRLCAGLFYHIGKTLNVAEICSRTVIGRPRSIRIELQRHQNCAPWRLGKMFSQSLLDEGEMTSKQLGNWKVQRISETQLSLKLPKGMQVTGEDLTIEDVMQAIATHRSIKAGRPVVRCCGGNTAIA